MPNFDRTGPAGKGSRTGRGLGKCNGASVSNSEESSPISKGQGQGQGRRGGGKGMCGKGRN